MSRILLALTTASLPVAFLVAASCTSFSDFSLAPTAPSEAAPLARDSATDSATGAVDAGLCPSPDSGSNTERYHLFVTPDVFGGDFAADAGATALAVADALCTQYGREVNPCTSWKALITTSASADMFARLKPVTTGYYVRELRDGAVLERQVFDGDASFMKGPSEPIQRDQRGNLIAPEHTGVWIGWGLLGLLNCGDWRTRDASGFVGTAAMRGPGWIDDGVERCPRPQHLYCIEQPPE